MPRHLGISLEPHSIVAIQSSAYSESERQPVSSPIPPVPYYEQLWGQALGDVNSCYGYLPLSPHHASTLGLPSDISLLPTATDVSDNSWADAYPVYASTGSISGTGLVLRGQGVNSSSAPAFSRPQGQHLRNGMRNQYSTQNDQYLQGSNSMATVPQNDSHNWSQQTNWSVYDTYSSHYDGYARHGTDPNVRKEAQLCSFSPRNGRTWWHAFPQLLTSLHSAFLKLLISLLLSVTAKIDVYLAYGSVPCTHLVLSILYYPFIRPLVSDSMSTFPRNEFNNWQRQTNSLVYYPYGA